MPLPHPHRPTHPRSGRVRDIQRFVVFLLAYGLSQYGTYVLLGVFVAPVFTGSAQLGFLITNVATACAGLLAAWLTRSWGPPLAWGRLTRRNVSGSIALLTLIYGVMLGAIHLMSRGEEPMMRALLNESTPGQSTYVLTTWILVVPITGTIGIIHLTFNAWPWERSRPGAILAAIVTTIAYLYVTTPYVYLSSDLASLVSMLLLFGARYVSGGILLPMLLTSYGTALGIGLDKLYFG